MSEKMTHNSCPDCGESLDYHCKENEVVVLSGMMKPKDGMRRFNTYNFGDLYKCSKCGTKSVSGFGADMKGEFMVKE